MKPLSLTLVALSVGMGMAVATAPTAHASTLPLITNPSGKYRLVVVEGKTAWPETNTVLRELRDKWRIPITGGKCTGREVSCIRLSFYSADDGAYGWGGPSGVRINLRPGVTDPGQRKEILYHEFGHAFGLPHNEALAARCQTSMAGGCQHTHGYYVLGYTPAEYQKILNFLAR